MQAYNRNVYKYYPVCRAGFFNDFMVRFTQTKEFEDPEECLPDFKFFCDKKLKTIRALEVWQRNNPYCYSPSKRKRFVRTFRRTFNWREEICKSYNNHLDIIGIFSLAKTQFNSHLWENYAKGGFCVELDYCSNFFKRQPSDILGTGELFPVNYSDTPIVFDARKFFSSGHSDYMQLEVFYQKTTRWHLEDEVRIIRFRCLADQQSDNGRVSLFKIPKCAILSVYFSHTAAPAFIEANTAIIRKNLGKIPVYRIVNETTNSAELISGAIGSGKVEYRDGI